MVEETKVQGTPPEVVEGQQLTAGVDAGVVEPVAPVKTFTQDEVNEIAGRTRQEERDKARREFDEERNRVRQEIQPQQKPSFFKQQASGLVNQLRDSGKIVDQDTIDAVAELLDRNISGIVDTHVRISHATRNTIDGIISNLEKDPNIGDRIKQYRTEIENQTLSNIPPQMLNEQSVRGMASLVIGNKVLSGELSFTQPKVPKPIPEVPSSSPSQKTKQSLSEEEKKAKEEYNLSEEEIKTGNIKRTYGKKTGNS